MSEYCIFAQYCYYEYTRLHASARLAPARDSPLFSNESTFPQTTGKDFALPPIASINPSKTDAAPSAAASPPGNLRGSDGPTGDACESTSGTKGFRTPACTKRHLIPICSERYVVQGLQKGISGDTIVQDCLTVLQPVRPEGYLAVLLRRLGILGEPMVHQRGELSPRDLLLRSQDSPRQRFFFLEQRPDPCPPRPDMSSSRQSSRRAALTKLSPSSARHNVSHLSRSPL